MAPSVRKIRVAMIDSGIHAAHPHVQGVAGGVGFDANGIEQADYVDRLGHGTAVAAAIRELAPAAELLAIKVFDRTLTASVRSLVAGIEWAVVGGAALVNLSLGTSNAEHAAALGAAAERASARGTVIVAAGEHDGVRWLPGTLEQVIRVELDWGCPRGTFTCATADGGPVFRTCGYPRPIPGVEPARNLKGLSFAVANMTGMTARLTGELDLVGYDALVGALRQQAGVSRVDS
jgi:subtilisin family serine protease